MKSPLAPFLVSVVIAFLIVSQGVGFLIQKQKQNDELRAKNQAAIQVNMRRRQELTSLKDSQEALTNTLKAATEGMVAIPPDSSAFAPFVQIGLTPRFSDTKNDLFHFGFKGSVEFHRFTPAVASLEGKYPLLRFTSLTMTSSRGPFSTTATTLAISGTFTLVKSQETTPQTQ